MTWHIDWPSFAFGTSAGFVIAIFLLGLLRAVAEVDMVPRYPVPEKMDEYPWPPMTWKDYPGGEDFCAEEGAHPEAGG